MMFLLQTKDNHVLHDFSFTLLEAIKYNNWFYGEDVYSYKFCNDIKSINKKENRKHIPIGSIEFVLNFYKKIYGINNIKPINIPKELNKYEYLKRNIVTEKTIDNLTIAKEEYVFVKSRDKFKDYVDFVRVEEIPLDKKLLISEQVDISSEWRCFIYGGELLDIRNYSGDFKLFPNIDFVEKVISNYNNAPNAYTLDIGILKDKSNIIIEVHDFFSCGLYGFSNYKYLPKMFIETHKKILTNK